MSDTDTNPTPGGGHGQQTVTGDSPTWATVNALREERNALLGMVDAQKSDLRARDAELAALRERIEYALRMTAECSAETVRSHVREALAPRTRGGGAE